MTLNIFEYSRNILDFLTGIGRLNIQEYSRNSKFKVFPNCKLGISWIFMNIFKWPCRS